MTQEMIFYIQISSEKVKFNDILCYNLNFIHLKRLEFDEISMNIPNNIIIRIFCIHSIIISLKNKTSPFGIV